jgi:hypothetical protein
MNKKEARKKIGINEDGVFIFGTVAANGDKEDRKSHSRSMKAMRYFLEQNPDVKNIIWLYHTVPDDERGMPLLSICARISHARNLEEETKLIEAGFEYVRYSEKDQVAIYRKRK